MHYRSYVKAAGLCAGCAAAARARMRPRVAVQNYCPRRLFWRYSRSCWTWRTLPRELIFWTMVAVRRPMWNVWYQSGALSCSTVLVPTKLNDQPSSIERALTAVRRSQAGPDIMGWTQATTMSAAPRLLSSSIAATTDPAESTMSSTNRTF